MSGNTCNERMNVNFTDPQVGKVFGFSHSGWGATKIEFRTIVKVGAKSFTDDQGERWTLSGRRFGGGGYHGTYAHDDTPEYREFSKKNNEAVDLERKCYHIKNLSWQKVPPEAIDRIYKILMESVLSTNRDTGNPTEAP